MYAKIFFVSAYYALPSQWRPDRGARVVGPLSELVRGAKI